MKNLFWFCLLFLALMGLSWAAGCDTYATCPYDGENSMQTGNAKYTPQGCMVREYAHNIGFSGKIHKFWQACDCQ